jgi:hypothetical protein
MSARDVKRCRDRAEELRTTSALMTSEDCRRIGRELAAEYEAVADQWETISVLTALLNEVYPANTSRTEGHARSPGRLR